MNKWHDVFESLPPRDQLALERKIEERLDVPAPIYGDYIPLSLPESLPLPPNDANYDLQNQLDTCHQREQQLIDLNSQNYEKLRDLTYNYDNSIDRVVQEKNQVIRELEIIKRELDNCYDEKRKLKNEIDDLEKELYNDDSDIVDI